jgi:ABC-2 type transport system permease protein
MANPIVYLVNGLRWTFYGTSDVPIGLSVALTLIFLGICIAFISWVFQSGWRLRT